MGADAKGKKAPKHKSIFKEVSMKRVKTKPKKKNPKVTLTESKLESIKRDATKDATDRACLVLIAAAADELGLNEDQIIDIMIRTDRYANHVDDHVIRMEDIRMSLEKSTGITLKGWV